jgi:UDP-glucose 4-epimerase
MKTALVTGGTGFIGVYLANQLYDMGYKVDAIDKAYNNKDRLMEGINFLLGDIRSDEIKKQYDIVYHLAALRSIPNSFAYPDEYISTNILGTYNTIKAFPSARVVFASSSAATENKSVYGITKKSAEHFVNMHSNSVSIRFMNVFGELQTDLQMAVPAFSYALKHNKKAIINGDGSFQRDYTYVKDLVDEMIRIGESKIKGQTEIGYGQPIKIIDLYKLISRLCKKKENFKLGPPRKGDMKYTCSKYKIKEPRYGFMEGMRRTIRWYMGEETF